MEHVSTETKLRLVQMIRAENQENRNRMRSREKLLDYGYSMPVSETEPIENPFFGFRIRLFLSLALFLCFFALQYTGENVGEWSAKEIRLLVSEDLDIKAIDFIEDFTYTLSDNF